MDLDDDREEMEDERRFCDRWSVVVEAVGLGTPKGLVFMMVDWCWICSA